MSREALAFGLIWVLTNFGNTVKGYHCSSFEALKLQDLANGNCQQIVNGTAQQWLTVECKMNKYHQNDEYFRCGSWWCQHFASCLHQTPDWKSLCTLKFRWFRFSRFDVTTAAGGINATFLKNIQVQYCGKKRQHSKYLVQTVAIKIKEHECQSKYSQKANPGLSVPTWSGSNMDTCDKFVNGTKDAWYKIQSYKSWCLSFATSCLRSQTLKKRCLRELKFYSKYSNFLIDKAFVVQIVSILSGTRIQLSYQRRTRNNPFAVLNIIRCGNENAGVVDDDDNDDDEEENKLQSKMLHSINLLDRKRKDSLQKALESFDSAIENYFNFTSANKTEQEKMDEVFLATNVLEEFVLGFAQYHLNQSVPGVNFTNNKFDLQVRRIFYQNESDFYIEETKRQNFIKIPSGNFYNGSLVLGMVYKDLNKIFETNCTDNNDTNKIRRLNTLIMSATIDPQPVTLKHNVTLMFKNLKAEPQKRNCMFWDVVESSPAGWSGKGCHVASMENSHTECTCNHLTHFAVLMLFDTEAGPGYDTISKTDKKALEIITYIGLTLSLIGITLTVIGYVFLTDMKGPLSQIRVSLVASLGVGQIIFLAGIGATENKGACVTVAALVQYFLIAAFCWMLVEGIYLYLFVVKVYNVSTKMKFCHGISWGVPVLVVAFSLSIAAGKDGIESFVSDEYCWMSSANSLIWIFVVFVVLIELLNILILVRVINEMTKMQQAKDSQTEQIRLGIRACVLLMPLLGVTWLFGLLSPIHKAFAYIFTIFNSTQGFLIFLLHCVRNTEIRARLNRKIHVMFPSITDRTSVKKSSTINESSSRNASPKKIEVQPCSRNSKSNRSSVEKTSL